jgi:hypothetical protein
VLVWLGLLGVCGINYRFGYLVAACGSSQSQFAHRLAKSIHDPGVCFMDDGRRLVGCIPEEGVVRLLQHSAVRSWRLLSGGPTAETRTNQKLISLGAFIGFISLLVIPELDHRFH